MADPKEQYLVINGQEVKVDKSFFDLTPEQQQAEVEHISNQLEKGKPSAEEKDTSATIPMAPAGGVIGAAVGPAIGPAVSRAVDMPIEAMVKEMSKTPNQFGNYNTPDSVKKWLATQSSNPFAGGRTQKEAYAKSEIQAGEPFKSRGSNIPIRKGNLSEPSAGLTLPQKTAQLITKSEKVGTPGVGRRMFGMGVAGAELGQMGEELSRGNYGRAALSGLGALGGAASQSHIKPVRAVGTGVAAAVPVIQKFFLPNEEPPEQYKEGKHVKKFPKLPMPQTASLAANLALGADSLQSSGEDLSRNIAARKYGSAANNLIDIGSTFSPYFLVPSIYSAGRSFSDTAASQLAQNPQYRQQLQNMSSSPLGGALSGDAGFASQIMGQHEYEEPEAPGEYGSLMRNTRLPGYAGGKAVAKKAVNLWEKYGYNPVKIAQDYPQTLHPRLAFDEDKQKFFAQKVLSPEAEAVQKARKAAQAQINKGDYEPFFDVSQRYYVDPSLYPLPDRTSELALPKTSKSMEKYVAEAQNPKALQKWREGFEKGSQSPDAKDWYAMGQLYDEFVKELGPVEGTKQFKARVADAMGATTGGSNPSSNLMTAAYANFMKQKGLTVPENTFEVPFPIGGRYLDSNLAQARKLHQAGTLTVDTPKRYNFSSNFLGHRDRPTLDEQMMGAYGKTAPEDIAYGLYEKELNNLAKGYGVNPVNFQDVTWAGLKDYPGKSMMQEINEMLARTSKITGEPQKEVLKGFIRADKPMYGVAGLGGLSQLSEDEEQ